MSFELNDLDGPLSRFCNAARSVRDANASVARFEEPISLARAERELERVLQSEHARLIARAASIRASRAPLSACFGQRPLGRGALRLWRTQWNELCATARASGLSMPRLLRRCATDDVAVWPSAVRLARAALALEPGSHHRRVLVACLFAEGRIVAAHAVEGGGALDHAELLRRARACEARDEATDADADDGCI